MPPPLQVKKATNSDPYGPAGAQLSDISDVRALCSVFVLALVLVGCCSYAWGASGCVCFEVQVVSKSPEARQEALQTLLTRCEAAL